MEKVVLYPLYILLISVRETASPQNFGPPNATHAYAALLGQADCSELRTAHSVRDGIGLAKGAIGKSANPTKKGLRKMTQVEAAIFSAVIRVGLALDLVKWEDCTNRKFPTYCRFLVQGVVPPWWCTIPKIKLTYSSKYMQIQYIHVYTVYYIII